MSGFDDFERSLFAQVPVRSASRRSTRRRWSPAHRTLILTTAGLLGASGVAFASALTWWQPTIGQPGKATQVAAQDPPSRDVLDSLAVLRRPQTADDRGSAARYALSLSDGQRFVRTDYVRELGITVRGNPVVLVPTGKTKEARPDDELCLWVAVGEARLRSAGGTCGTLADLKAGRLSIAVGARPDPVQEERRAANRRRQMAEAKAAGKSGSDGFTFTGETYTKEETQLTVVGLAPDGASSAMLGGRTARVAGNAFKAHLDEPDLPERIRFVR